jgi:Zn-dependent protease with chaperone function
MSPSIEYHVNPKENFYFYLRLIVSLGLYYLIYWLVALAAETDARAMTALLPICLYVLLFIIYLFFRFGVLVGFLKGNAIRLNRNQFPEIYKEVVRQCEMLGIKNEPAVFILQSGGILNAFAASFLGRNYIVLYSEVVETALEQDKNILEFIIGHELGHIKRRHMLWKLLFFPSWLVPFLASAYSRACEYTCDNIGHALSPAGTTGGLLLLASGKSIYKKVNLNEFIAQRNSEDGFWCWLAEKVSSHPHLVKRINAFHDLKPISVVIEPPPVAERKEEDHSRFMPR